MCSDRENQVTNLNEGEKSMTTSFNNPWYHSHIANTINKYSNADANAAIISAGIMTGFVFLSEALKDFHGDEKLQDVISSMNGIEGAIEQLADAVREQGKGRQ